MRSNSSKTLLLALMMMRYIRSISYFLHHTKKKKNHIRPPAWAVVWGSAGAGCPVALRSPSSSLLLLLLPGFLLVASRGTGALGITLASSVGEGGGAARDVDVLPVIRDVLQCELGAIAGTQPHGARPATQGRVAISSFFGDTGGGDKKEGQVVSAGQSTPQAPAASKGSHGVSNPDLSATNLRPPPVITLQHYCSMGQLQCAYWGAWCSWHQKSLVSTSHHC